MQTYSRNEKRCANDYAVYKFNELIRKKDVRRAILSNARMVDKFLEEVNYDPNTDFFQWMEKKTDEKECIKIRTVDLLKMFLTVKAKFLKKFSIFHWNPTRRHVINTYMTLIIDKKEVIERLEKENAEFPWNHSWIPREKIDISLLTLNPHPMAIEWLKTEDFTEEMLLNLTRSTTVGAISLYMKKKGKRETTIVEWSNICANPTDEAMELIHIPLKPILWERLSVNSHPEAIQILKANLPKINYITLCQNPNPDAISILAENPSKIYYTLSCNHSDEGMELLKKYPKFVEAYCLSGNSCPKAMEVIKETGLMPYLLSGGHFSLFNFSMNRNPEAMDIILSHLDQFHWTEIFANPSPKACEIIWACFSNTWKEKYCSMVSIDIVAIAEERLHHALNTNAVKELSRNTNPSILPILRANHEFVDYKQLSANPLLFA